MQYIVLDLEWNQPWPGSPSAQRKLPIHGEIIQIGAVRMNSEQALEDEFQILVRPRYYRKLNKRVSALTGLKDARLREEGVSFPEAMARFRQWCGEDCVFLSWGFDDAPILKENLLLFGLPVDWISQWYNAQIIFNAQTDGSASQKALKTAMELFDITPERPAHDALGDAHHTALVCQRLALAKGCRDYMQALYAHENGFHGTPPEGCLTRQVFHGFLSKEAALAAMAESTCPTCAGPMSIGRWYPQPGIRFMAMAVCPEHGKFLLRVRLSRDGENQLKASRLIYDGTSGAAKAYEELSQKSRRQKSSQYRKSTANTQ